SISSNRTPKALKARAAAPPGWDCISPRRSWRRTTEGFSSKAQPDRAPRSPSISQSGSRCLANILVVDDDRNIRRMLATALEAAGYIVVEASDGAQALARLGGASAIDLVVTDVRMENMDGIRLLEQIKQTRPAM